jgi:Pretoxin HINT domain/Novel toxin 21
MKWRLLADRRGGNEAIQTIVVVAMVAVAGIAAYKALGSATSDGADCAGKSIAALAAVNCKDGQPLPASVAPPPEAPQGDREEQGEDREERDPEADALEELKQLALDILGVTDAVKCFTEGDILACAMTLVSFSPFKLIGTAVKLAKNAKRIAQALDRLLAARKAKKADEAADNVADAGGACKGGKCDKPGVCFAPGTLVHTDRGAVPIEQLAPGDRVLSRDDRTGEEDYRPIAQTFVTPDQPLLAVALEDSRGELETLEVTAPHPFQVEGRGWVAAGDLVPGDRVISSGGGRLRVASNQDSGRTSTVHNFEVEEFHTYFVGQGAAWVHNQQGPFCSKAAAREAAAKLGFDRRIPPQRAPFNSHGQDVFFDGKRYITPDVDQHSGGTWKMFDRRGRRIGTFDENLNRIGP